MLQQQLLRGAIYIVNLPSSNGSIQQNIRPCVLISNRMANLHSSVLHICPVSSKTSKSKLPTHISLSKECGLLRDSIALCEQTMLINKDTIMQQVGFCDEETLKNIDRGIAIQFGLVDARSSIAYA